MKLILLMLSLFFTAPALAIDFTGNWSAGGSATAPDPSVDGTWTGKYSYGDGTGVEFVAQLNRFDGTLTGKIVEPNTFGDKSVKALTSNLQGTYKTDSIQFTKTYDGTGGVSHSLEYQGILSGNKITGTWLMNGSGTSGTFEMNRQ